jgi:hypothetical protein
MIVYKYSCTRVDTGIDYLESAIYSTFDEAKEHCLDDLEFRRKREGDALESTEIDAAIELVKKHWRDAPNDYLCEANVAGGCHRIKKLVMLDPSYHPCKPDWSKCPYDLSSFSPSAREWIAAIALITTGAIGSFITAVLLWGRP